MSTYDVVIIGGGPAGLGAALTLCRARRDVLVIDAGTPRNARAGQVHSYLGREGIGPRELLTIGRAEVEQYGGAFRSGTVADVERISASTLRLALADGSTVDARRVLVATGVVDKLPAIPGLADRWGRDVLHCAYCHAYEVRDKAVGLIGSGAASLHQAQLWRQWTDRVALFTNDSVELTATSRAELAARGIAVVSGPVTGIEVSGDELSGIRVGDTVVSAQVAVVFPVSVAQVGLLAKLGLRAEEQLMDDQIIGATVAAENEMGMTTVPGVWVAGNVRGHRAQVIDAAAQGGRTGAMINIDLVNEDVRHAVAVHPFTPELEAEVTERVLGVRRHGLTL
ncbi:MULTISPECIES: NAD(P)/FAD-dependent oxidoreductase [Streptomyces]|nr:NAD(P)/FAD-dependent oxidoreductase [Streptomyces sp. 4R-3d]TFI26974.1 NAD(P)/FAD-dependent oxidoreductase [Streptomyces sp. 4R-3d]